MAADEKLSVIPEVYFDIIGRLIPGGLLLGVYFFRNLKEDLNFPTTVFAFICSYSIGFSLNILGEFISVIVSKIEYIFKEKPVETEDIWGKIRKDLRESDKVLMIKLYAEFAMFKSLTIGIIICMIYRPNIFDYIITWKYVTGSCLLSLFFLFCSFHQRESFIG